MTARPCAAIGILALSIGLSGCFATETEIVRTGDSVRLCGARFVQDDERAHEQTTYTWDNASRGYFDPERASLVRFGHLRNEGYVIQIQFLKDVSPDRPPKPIAEKAYVLSLLRVSPPRLWVQSPKCLGLRTESPVLAQSFGVDLNDSGLSSRLTGSRGGILGFLLAGLDCRESGTLDFRITPETLTPGGPELAPAAAKPDRANILPFLAKRCAGGEIEACYKLGQVYLRGEGVPKDAPRAAGLFEKVCAAKEMGGCLDLGLLYRDGNGVARNEARAVELLTEACSGQEAYACEMVKK